VRVGGEVPDAAGEDLAVASVGADIFGRIHGGHEQADVVHRARLTAPAEIESPTSNGRSTGRNAPAAKAIGPAHAVPTAPLAAGVRAVNAVAGTPKKPKIATTGVMFSATLSALPGEAHHRRLDLPPAPDALDGVNYQQIAAGDIENQRSHNLHTLARSLRRYHLPNPGSCRSPSSLRNPPLRRQATGRRGGRS
jgi:hypothetical protein